jgi:prepilin-type N-terminal cleavage/methylation domain-containing protein
MKTLKKKEEGFTIIEVLIVLAIAGLIMVIVFLAVPALQRNSRNTQRTNDASRVVAAINECTNNANGNLGTCDAQGELTAYIDMNQNQQLSTYQVGGALGSNTNTARFIDNSQCTTAGNGQQTGGGTRAFTITFNVETSGGVQERCISG